MRICTPTFCAYLYVSVCILILNTCKYALLHSVHICMYLFVFCSYIHGITCRCTFLFLNICAYALPHSVHICMYLSVFGSCKQAQCICASNPFFLCGAGSRAGVEAAAPPGRRGRRRGRGRRPRRKCEALKYGAKKCASQHHDGQIKCSPRAMESRCFFIIWPSERFQR
jgi:hypothetical protein